MNEEEICVSWERNIENYINNYARWNKLTLAQSKENFFIEIHETFLDIVPQAIQKILASRSWPSCKKMKITCLCTSSTMVYRLIYQSGMENSWWILWGTRNRRKIIVSRFQESIPWWLTWKFPLHHTNFIVQILNWQRSFWYFRPTTSTYRTLPKLWSRKVKKLRNVYQQSRVEAIYQVIISIETTIIDHNDYLKESY